jgi:small multidrug resistance family-3 protein
LRSWILFVSAALAEIGGAYLVWQAVREGAAPWVAAAGAVALVGYGFLASLQTDLHFGRVLAAYGGVFVFGSLLWASWWTSFGPTASISSGLGPAFSGRRSSSGLRARRAHLLTRLRWSSLLVANARRNACGR